jgi:hypothetical protein
MASAELVIVAAVIAELVIALGARHVRTPLRFEDLGATHLAPNHRRAELPAYFLIKGGLARAAVPMPLLTALEANGLSAVRAR